MLRKLKLYGELAEFIGHEEFEVKVNSISQAVSFLVCNFPKSEAYIAERSYKVLVGDYEVGKDELAHPIGQSDLHIVPVIAGAGGTFAANAVGVHTTKILGINTTTVAGSATSEGAIQVRGNIAIEEGLLTLDSNINTSVSVPSGKNAMLIGPTTVGAAATIDVAQGSTLVVV